MTQNYEGWVPNIYEDSEGYKTIGWGFNIDDEAIAKLLPKDVLSGKRKLTKEEATPIFTKLYANAKQDAINFVGEDVFSQLDPVRQNVLIDMSYNLGADKLGGFKELRKALQSGDYKKAAYEMKNSKWFGQVGGRSKEHYKKMLNEPSYQQNQQLFGGQKLEPDFSTAFAQARQQGLTEFEWHGKKYNTKLKGE